MTPTAPAEAQDGFRSEAVNALRKRGRRQPGGCVHLRIPHECRICVEVEAVYLRIKARNANGSQTQGEPRSGTKISRHARSRFRVDRASE